jgi:hypothetical protein
VNACTVIARNYLAHARVLAESFLEHHPDGTFTALLLDDFGREVEASEPFAIVHADEIGLDARELHRMAMIYDVLELATAVKPWFLRTLLNLGHDHAAYFDPDIQIFAPLDDLAELARRHAIVLTPHTTEPFPRDGLEPSERTILISGMFNLGFIALGAKAGSFLDWWMERLRWDCIVDPGNGYFVDQRWVDFVPTLFEHHVLRDPGCNVATWNLASRMVKLHDGVYTVNGRPLRFFHFSGFDSRTPDVLSRFQSRAPRILLAEHEAVGELCRAYARLLREHGQERAVELAYGFAALGNGRRIDRALRRLSRSAYLAAAERGVPDPPDPFDPASADAFVGWLADGHRFEARRKLARYLRALYDVDPGAPPARLSYRGLMALRRVKARRRERVAQGLRDGL